MDRLRVVFRKFAMSYVSALVVGGVVVAVGLGLMLASHAATSAIAAEAESGTLSAGATSVSDSTASGGKAIKFGAAVTPTPPPTPPTGNVVNVSTAAALTTALANAKAGDTITLAAGTYSGHFVSTASGKSGSPITITGSRSAILDGGSTGSGYTLQIGTKNSASSVSYWALSGFSVTGGQKGVIFDNVQHSTIDSLYVHDVGEEAVHLRDFSSDNVISNSTVTNSGLDQEAYGEGIYVGSAVSNWSTYSQDKADNSNRNQILNNSVSKSGAENIDIKEGTHTGVISGNTLDGTNMCYDTTADCNSADSLIDMKGEGWTIKSNTGMHVHPVWKGGGQLDDGFQVHLISGGEAEGSGSNNIFTLNKISDVGGYGINVTGKGTGNVVKCDNTVSSAGNGLTNVTCQ